jgi:hypothetical protein
MPLTSFPTNFSSLPTVSFVIPNQDNNMENGTDPQRIQQADTWLQTHLDPYVQWAKNNNSLLIVTWDQDDTSSNNQIPTLFVGPMVRPGSYSEPIDHYDVLRTLQDMFNLSSLGNSASATAILDIWSAPAPATNLLSDPGFENNGQGWKNFGLAGRSVVSTQAHTGSYSAQVLVTTTNRVVFQDVTVSPSKTYTASGWVKTSGAGGTGAELSVLWLDGFGVAIGTAQVVGRKTGTVAWTQLSGSVVAPANAAKARFRVLTAADPDNAGMAWFDDCTLK